MTALLYGVRGGSFPPSSFPLYPFTSMQRLAWLLTLLGAAATVSPTAAYGQARETEAQFLSRFRNAVRNAPRGGVARAVSRLACTEEVARAIRQGGSFEDPEVRREVRRLRRLDHNELNFAINEEPYEEQGTWFSFEVHRNAGGRYCVSNFVQPG